VRPALGGDGRGTLDLERSSRKRLGASRAEPARPRARSGSNGSLESGRLKCTNVAASGNVALQPGRPMKAGPMKKRRPTEPAPAVGSVGPHQVQCGGHRRAPRAPRGRRSGQMRGDRELRLTRASSHPAPRRWSSRTRPPVSEAPLARVTQHRSRTKPSSPGARDELFGWDVARSARFLGFCRLAVGLRSRNLRRSVPRWRRRRAVQRRGSMWRPRNPSTTVGDAQDEPARSAPQAGDGGGPGLLGAYPSKCGPRLWRCGAARTASSDQPLQQVVRGGRTPDPTCTGRS